MDCERGIMTNHLRTARRLFILGLFICIYISINILLIGKDLFNDIINLLLLLIIFYCFANGIDNLCNLINKYSEFIEKYDKLNKQNPDKAIIK